MKVVIYVVLIKKEGNTFFSINREKSYECYNQMV